MGFKKVVIYSAGCTVISFYYLNLNKYIFREEREGDSIVCPAPGRVLTRGEPLKERILNVITKELITGAPRKCSEKKKRLYSCIFVVVTLKYIIP